LTFSFGFHLTFTFSAKPKHAFKNLAFDKMAFLRLIVKSNETIKYSL